MNTIRFSILTGLLSLALSVLTLLAARNRAAAPYAVAAIVVLFVVTVRYGVLGGVLRSHLPGTMTSGAMWRVTVMTLIFMLGLPVIFIVLATSGGFRSAVLATFASDPGEHGWGALGVRAAAWLEAGSLLGIPVLVVVGPEYLRTRGRAVAANSLVPGWLAAFASALTAAYIVLLHFGAPGKAGLVKSPLGAWSVAAFGVALLLAPFYRVVAKECLQRGLAVVFDPGRWWSAWCVAYREMRGTSAAIAEAGEPALAAPVPALVDSTKDSGGGRAAGSTRDGARTYRPASDLLASDPPAPGAHEPPHPR
jgi:hypothetical protein